MKNFALHQAEAGGFILGVPNVGTYVRNWQARRSVRSLERLDDHLLRDMGVTRAGIAAALRQPLSTNPALFLESMSRG